MDTITVTFLGIGAFALLLMLLSLLGGHLHLGHVHLGHVHLGHLHTGGADAGGMLTLPSIAGFIGVFGFGGAIVAALVPGHGTGTVLLAAGAGVAAGVPAAWLAGRLMRAAMNMSTDATLSSTDLVGGIGVVVTEIPDGGYGEVRLSVAGQMFKLNARSDTPIARGVEVFVIEAPSPTSVLVEPLPQSKESP